MSLDREGFARTDAPTAAADLYDADACANRVVVNEAYCWFYAPMMIRDEVLFLKCYDSMRDGRARFMPHTSFEDPTAPVEKPPRESIESRTPVCFAEQSAK